MRDALLREAREALKNAAGLGAPGRFTDQELDGFRLGPVIGRGGMGEVYAAERLSDKREAALKLLRMDALVERTALARFERESRIVASIRSPNVGGGAGGEPGRLGAAVHRDGAAARGRPGQPPARLRPHELARGGRPGVAGGHRAVGGAHGQRGAPRSEAEQPVPRRLAGAPGLEDPRLRRPPSGWTRATPR
jgi:hypothetical protein